MKTWRSLEELENSPGFEEYLHREFPREASIWSELTDSVSRRNFIKLMSASFALSGLQACTRMPAEKIIAYVIQPENFIPDKKQFYASASLLQGFAKGILVESHESRPTKIEGSPAHPGSWGSTDIFAQAEILTLYDPDRSESVTHLGVASDWDLFLAEIDRRLPAWQEKRGEGLTLLTETLTSPTLISQIEAVLEKFPKAKWYAHDPLASETPRLAGLAAFSEDLRPIYHFERTKFILSLDADFLGNGPAQQAYARTFMDCRRSRGLLFMADSSVTLTGAAADDRLPLRPTEIEGIARAVAKKIGLPIEAPAWTLKYADWISKTSAQLLKHAGSSVVLAGDQQSESTWILAHAMNEHLGNATQTIDYIKPVEAEPHGYSADFLEQLKQGKIQDLFLLGGNPAYDFPGADLTKVDFKVHLGLYEDETAKLCQWHLPETHFLENWGDAKAYDGTVSFQQPLIEPLYNGKSASEILSFLLEPRVFLSPKQLLKTVWKSAFTEQAIGQGMLKGSQSKSIKARLHSDWHAKLKPLLKAEGDALEKHQDYEISFRADPTIGGGRYSNNGWLQELPKPVLQMTWGNAVILSPSSAAALGVSDEDLVEIKLNTQSIQAPVLRVPGHPNESITIHLGYGRTQAGSVGSGHGFNAYSLMSGPNQKSASGAEIRKVGATGELALTHFHSNMEGRNLIRKGQVPEDAVRPPVTLLVPYPSAQEAWAMVIDLNSCIGCNACTIACQAENNIPIVGKEQVRRSREMHWIRVDRYFEGGSENPRIYFQPVPCMHCEKAPCEEVCPTAATNHSHDGINQMVYNRCVGTRYCSNNCPYKVRRFNFFEYSHPKNTLLPLMHNPNVTVRSRGVMEKCTYCTQRIQDVRIRAEKEDRKIRDGEIVTACQAVCPTSAIIFGDQNDPRSRVALLKKLPSNYSLLNDLGTVPRTTYLSIEERV